MHLAAKKGKTFDKVECFNEGNGQLLIADGRSESVDGRVRGRIDAIIISYGITKRVVKTTTVTWHQRETLGLIRGHRHENNHVNIQETACIKLNGEAQAHLTKIKGAYLALLNNSNLNAGPHRSLSPNAPSSRYTRRNVLLCRSSSPQPAHDMA
ncbi:unnamed protein product [Vitrella brassicaformis CCMP3155]|uniref:Uncharacterized protein n=1 Tax=Vitrella brassicaformis (strain CCMP3155) TaxID=1169540 RepID=A0A0G4GC59_VITBC|nr:unnamed protein product [Vitrella brassicaformis CCMP3155]|eukprot:CEM26749.1 unnamed protein product [Vitrella brassicaformis CCMP3155]